MVAKLRIQFMHVWSWIFWSVKFFRISYFQATEFLNIQENGVNFRFRNHSTTLYYTERRCIFLPVLLPNLSLFALHFFLYFHSFSSFLSFLSLLILPFFPFFPFSPLLSFTRSSCLHSRSFNWYYHILSLRLDKGREDGTDKIREVN